LLDAQPTVITSMRFARSLSSCSLYSSLFYRILQTALTCTAPDIWNLVYLHLYFTDKCTLV
jgi:hypothetical protein